MGAARHKNTTAVRRTANRRTAGSNVNRVQALTRENRELKAGLRYRTKELGFFLSLAKALTSTLELKKVLKVIMTRAQQLIKAEAWALLLVDEAADELYFDLIHSKHEKSLKSQRLKSGQGAAGWVVRYNKPLLVPDLSKDDRFAGGIDLQIGSPSRSLLCVPIVNKKRTIGVLEAVNKTGDGPFNDQDLTLLVKMIDQAEIAIERAYLYQKMADLAVTDDLTKLFNFRYLDQTLDIEIRRGQRYGANVSLIFLDMDYFKQVNDRYGHLMGSRVLIEVAQILIQNLRDVDIIARYGGDEFVVVLPETPLDVTYRIAQRLRVALREHTFLEAEGHPITLTASYGIASYPTHARNKKDLIRLADQAMYRAKNSGRDQICLAEHPTTKPASAPGG
ncbi:MAG TPA: sensor domain-containing diguanylate cyclase [Nitrospiria bacterium]|nr:sensor domain-containing diguanylate cyclase [Nitrospiria bacterium]